MPVCANAVQGRDNADVSAHAANKEARNAEQSFMASSIPEWWPTPQLFLSSPARRTPTHFGLRLFTHVPARSHSHCRPDESNARAASERSFGKGGYADRTAADGFKALGKIDEFAPDVILTDLKMPGLDGIAFMDKARVGLPANGFRRHDRVRIDFECGGGHEAGRRELSPQAPRSRSARSGRGASDGEGASRPGNVASSRLIARAQRSRPRRRE